MMRLHRPLSMETDDDPSKKKREAERLEEEKNRIETRKQRYDNDGVEAWQRARRAEKLRFQALKADDQEAYMKMVEGGKNERLAMLLGKTNDLLVQREKDSIEQPNMIQIEGMMMLSLYNNNLNGILADEEEMGLGRTIQTIISLIAHLMENKGVNGPHLIVAPKAVLPNWVNEFTTRAPSISALVYDGRVDERKALRAEYSGEGKFNVLITHYDLIIRDKAFLRKIHWHYLVVDERGRHRLKNDDRVIPRTLVSGYRIRRRLLLTGSPIQNSLQELWSLLNFLLPNLFDSVDNFKDWFNAPFPDKCDVSLTDEEQLLVIQRLHHVIRPFILRRRKDEVEKYLPSKTQVGH